MEFWSNRSIAELAQAQKVVPLKDPSVLAGGIPDDEDVDAFLNEIYTARRNQINLAPVLHE